MDQSTFGAVVTFTVYLLAVFGIGAWFYWRNSDLSQFALGGRRLGAFVASISSKVSDSSAWLLLGLPGAFYASGMGNLWMVVGLAVGFYLSWLILAERLRDYSERAIDRRTGLPADSVTLPGFFATRFHSDAVRGVAGLITLGFYVVYLGSGFVATGILFDQVFGTGTVTGILLGGGAVMVYSGLGGFLAASYTDVMQGVLMFVSLAVVSVIALVAVGGPGAAADTIASFNPALASPLSEVAAQEGGWATVDSLGPVAVVSGLAWGLGYFGSPHILARFMGIDSSRSVKSARRIGLFLSVTLLLLASVIGMLAIVHFGPGMANPENAYIRLVSDLFPGWLAGIFLAAILAAIMSTADSQLVVAATTLTEDFYRAFVHREASDRALIWLTRATVIAVSLGAMLIAMQGGTVLDLVSYAWAGFAAAFGPVLLAALFSRRTNWVGALCGMVAGGATVVIYEAVDTIGLYEMIPGFLAGLLAIWVGNKLGPEPSPRLQESFAAPVDGSREQNSRMPS